MTIELHQSNSVWRVRLARPDNGNALDAAMVTAMQDAARRCEAAGGTVLVIEGGTEAFCSGGDLRATADATEPYDPEPLYGVWQTLSDGPFVSVAVVRGRVTAGGVGLAAACDIVLCDRTASFSLSEMLFGLHPALVLPFLARRVGAQKAHYLTLTTTPISAADAVSCDLADAVDDDVDALLRAHLMRLRRLTRPAIVRYKSYRAGLDDGIARNRAAAIAANREIFADAVVRENIRRYVTEMKFPWE